MTDSRFIELSARDRAKGLLDAGTYRELLGAIRIHHVSLAGTAEYRPGSR